MIWEIVGWDGGTQNKQLAFICGNDRANYESRCKGITTPSQWVKDFFLQFEAYPGGRGEVFWFIHEMDIADKHRAIRPVLRATTHPPFQIFYADGRPFIRMAGNQFIGGLSDTISIADVPQGGYVELDSDADCTPSIFFPDIRSADAFVALNGFVDSVFNALKDFEAAVTKHPKT